MKKTILGFKIAGKPVKAEISEAWHRHLIPEHFEVSIMSCIFPLIKTFLDIGSNEGIYCLVFANTKNKEKNIYAFEPQKKAVEALQQTIKINKWQSFFKVLNYGLGANTQNLKIFKDGSSTGASFKYKTKNFEETKIKKLDDFIALEKIQPDLIKIDVEGFEQEVLKGSIKTLKENSPIIYLEILKKSSSKRNTIKILNELDYNIYVIRERQLVKFQMDFQEIDMYFCIKKEKLYLIDQINSKLKSRFFYFEPFRIQKGNKFNLALNFIFLILRYNLRKLIK